MTTTDSDIVNAARRILFPDGNLEHEAGSDELGKLVNLLRPTVDVRVVELNTESRQLPTSFAAVHPPRGNMKLVAILDDDANFLPSFNAAEDSTSTHAVTSTEQHLDEAALPGVRYEVSMGCAGARTSTSSPNNIPAAQRLPGLVVPNFLDMNVRNEWVLSHIAAAQRERVWAFVLPVPGWWSRFHGPKALLKSIVPCALRVLSVDSSVRIVVAVPDELGHGDYSLRADQVHMVMAVPPPTITGVATSEKLTRTDMAVVVGGATVDGKSLYAYGTEEDARSYAHKHSVLYGWSVFDQWWSAVRYRWWVGTAEELAQVGVLSPIDPTADPDPDEVIEYELTDKGKKALENSAPGNYAVWVSVEYMDDARDEYEDVSDFPVRAGTYETPEAADEAVYVLTGKRSAAHEPLMLGGHRTPVTPSLRELSETDVNIALIRTDSDEEVHYTDLDADFARAEVARIKERISSGDKWAWFLAEVRAEWKGIVHSEYLDCCSYDSEEDFRNSPYFTAMKAEALMSLNAAVRRQLVNIQGLMPSREKGPKG